MIHKWSLQQYPSHTLTQVEGWCLSMVVVDQYTVGMLEVVWCQILVRVIQQKAQMVVVWCCNDHFGAEVLKICGLCQFVLQVCSGWCQAKRCEKLGAPCHHGSTEYHDLRINCMERRLDVRQKLLQYFGKGLGAQQPLQLPGQDSVSIDFFLWCPGCLASFWHTKRDREVSEGQPS